MLILNLFQIRSKHLPTDKPKNIAITTYDSYDLQNGVSDTEMVAITRQQLFISNESTRGKSAT